MKHKEYIIPIGEEAKEFDEETTLQPQNGALFQNKRAIMLMGSSTIYPFD